MNTEPHPDEDRRLRPSRVPLSRKQKITVLIVWLGLAGALAAVLFPLVNSARMKGGLAGQLCAGRQIYLSLRNYASEMEAGGRFPAYADRKNQVGLVTTSNQAFELLVPRYLDDKKVFFNKSSAWCDRRVEGAGFANRIFPGENDWIYVRGLNDQSHSRFPLLATAVAPETTRYVSDPEKPGGAWKGVNAVVMHSGGSGELVATTPAGDGTFFIPRSDKPAANALEKADDWMNDAGIQLLYPELPNQKALPAGAKLTAEGDW
jgi:hypothetical protein